MPTAQSPSPPPPQAPTAITPGARASAFQTLYANALANTLRTISYESFAACFPSIAVAAPSSLRSLHENFIQRLSHFASEEFQTILTERAVVRHLNDLETLIATAEIRKARAPDDAPPPVPPHLLDAQTIVAAHLDPVRVGQQSQLNAKLQTTQSQNAVLAQRIAEQRAEMEGLLEGLEASVMDLEKAGESLGNEATALSGEARVAEETIRSI